MENTQQQKTPEQWFQQLKEPYRSEAIKGINKEVLGFQDYPESLDNALFFCLYWDEKYNPTRNDWEVIYNSIKAGETTYLEPEDVSLINEVNNSQVTEQQNEIESEKVELRPEDLVSGEVYTMVDKENKDKWTIKLKTIDLNAEPRLNNVITCDMYVYLTHEILINHKCTYYYNNIYHATPEEKALLLGEEETELEKVKKLLEESNRLYALKTIEFTKLQEKFEELEELSDALKESWDNKVEEIEHLKIKQQLEPKGEKVYFYIEPEFDTLMPINSIDKGLPDIPDNCKIYEAVCIGKKKSVLVNE